MVGGRYNNKLHVFSRKILFREFALKGAFMCHTLCVNFLFLLI
jgi:hypothetical protein